MLSSRSGWRTSSARHCGQVARSYRTSRRPIVYFPRSRTGSPQLGHVRSAAILIPVRRECTPPRPNRHLNARNPPWSLLPPEVRHTRDVAGSQPQTDAFPALALEQFNHANDRRPCARPPPAGDETHKLWLTNSLSRDQVDAALNAAREETRSELRQVDFGRTAQVEHG